MLKLCFCFLVGRYIFLFRMLLVFWWFVLWNRSMYCWLFGSWWLFKKFLVWVLIEFCVKEILGWCCFVVFVFFFFGIERIFWVILRNLVCFCDMKEIILGLRWCCCLLFLFFLLGLFGRLNFDDLLMENFWIKGDSKGLYLNLLVMKILVYLYVLMWFCILWVCFSIVLMVVFDGLKFILLSWLLVSEVLFFVFIEWELFWRKVMIYFLSV